MGGGVDAVVHLAEAIQASKSFWGVGLFGISDHSKVFFLAISTYKNAIVSFRSQQNILGKKPF